LPARAAGRLRVPNQIGIANGQAEQLSSDETGECGLPRDASCSEAGACADSDGYSRLSYAKQEKMDSTVPEVVQPGASSASRSSYQVHDLLRLLRRRWKLVAGITVVVVAAGVGMTTLQKPIYAAHATLLITSTNETDVFNPQQDQFGAAQRRVATESAVVKSSAVAALVKQQLGSAPPVTTTGASDADIITITARDSDPARATQIANAYANAYVDTKRKEGTDDLLAASKQVQDQVNALQQQINALDQQVQNAPADQRDAVSQSVDQRRSALLSEQAGFGQTSDQLQVRLALASGGASVVGPAAVPTTPVEPRPLRTGALALFLGLLLGIGAAFLRENVDDRIRNKEELERASDALPVLGVIDAYDSADALPITLTQPSSTCAEEYRTLRTAIQFLGLDRRLRVIQVTSPNLGEGKTTTIANLGVALACAGVNVCIVDCDLRRPRLAALFGLDSTVGFASVLLGQSTLDDALQASEALGPFLRILPAGPIPPNPSELLASARMQKVVESLAERYDVVLIDTPPTLPVADAMVVSRMADAVLVVAAVGSTTRRNMHRALELMGTVSAPVIGSVLNRAKEKARDDYGYGQYTSQPEPVKKGRKAKRKKNSERRRFLRRDKVGASR
jgi:capsular exopolysaccharide synthesis family protein